MYTAKYRGLMVFGGNHLWVILNPQGKKLCTVISAEAESPEVQNLLIALNWRFIEEEFSKTDKK